jgi:tetratricopeptide (TPR) repeat protein
MASLIDGLRGYEVVMLILGVLLFAVSLYGFVRQLTGNRKLTPLVPFFGLSILMMGYAGIKSFQIQDGVIQVEKLTSQVAQDPTDPAKRQALQAQINQLGSRQFSGPASLTTLARAQYALGDEAAAATDLQAALKRDPLLPQAKELQHKIALVNSVPALAAQVQANPEDINARSALQKNLQELQTLPIANPNAMTKVAQGQAAVGNYPAALDTVKKAITISPNTVNAQPLAESLKRKVQSNTSINKVSP